VDARFRILGPIEVELAGGRRAQVPRGRALSFLALLLTRHGAAVHVDRVVDELWEQDGPQHARGAVQVLASRLRTALGDDLVVHEGGGYALRVAPGGLDADRFAADARRGRDELARGDPAAAATILRDALGLWRGAALADVGGARFAQPEIARLEELHLACLGDRLEAELACGRHADVAGELDALIPEHPLDERLRGLQMTALYHAGRQADALAAYRAARRALVDGLGVEPSPRLRELEAAILRQDLRAPRPAHAEAPPDARRWVTCVFAQTAGPGIDPESLRAAADCFHGVARRTCDRHRGRVVELRGDAVLAVFGIPAAGEDDAQRAVRAASELAASDQLPFGLGVRCGACTGEVVTAGADALVVGDALATAERIGRTAEPGEVRLADATWRVVGHGVRGARLPGGDWRLEAIDADAPAIRRRLDGPLVGRDVELALLRTTLARVARERAPEVLTVLGEPGIGKSRLVGELGAIAGDAGTVLTGHCPAQGPAVTFWPLREAVAQARGDRTWEALAAALGIPPAAVLRAAAAVGLSDAAAGGSLVWAFRHLFGALARRRPLTLVVDDAHRAGPALLDLLLEVLGGLRDAPVLLVWAARSDEHAARPGLGAELVLPALSPAASRSLVANLTGAPGAERIVAAAGGNPLFLEQLVAYVGEQATPGALPPALHALLAARLDALDPRDRSTLALASITGDRCDPDAVHALAKERSRADIERACRRLAERDLLTTAEGGGLRFRHILIRDAAYGSLVKAERARLHERHAGWLDAQPGLSDADAKVGFQLEAAHRLAAEVGEPSAAALGERAGLRLAAAAGAAHRRGDLHAEIGLLERAIALLGNDRPAGATLLPDLVTALTELSVPARAESIAAHAVNVCGALGLAGPHARALVEHQRVLLALRPESFDPRASARVAASATATLRASGDERGLAGAVHHRCELAWLIGDPVASSEHAAEMLAVADRAGSDFDAALALMFSAWCFVEGPWPAADALARYAALASGGARGPTAALAAAGGHAILVALSGRNAEARDEMARARAGLGKRGLDRLAIYLALLDSVGESLAGDAAAAGRAVGDARALLSGPTDRWYEATLNVEAAIAVLAEGRDATAAVARVEAVPAPCDLEWVVKRHRARAGLAAQRGDAATAVAEARLAVAAAETGGLLLVTAGAHAALADALRGAGDATAATAAEAAADAILAAKGVRHA
jgi:DNA-binding SARP family transcriptional activator